MAGPDSVNIVLPTQQADIGQDSPCAFWSSADRETDHTYDEVLDNLKTRPPIIPRSKTAAQKQAAVQDYYRNVRTNVLLAWALSNVRIRSVPRATADREQALLAATILHGDYSNTFSANGNGRTQIFMVIILVFVGLSALLPLSTTLLTAIRLQ